MLVLAAGAWLRLSNLGVNTLASDEMNHYFVGQALDQNRGPVLPSGARYTRGLEYSFLVSKTLPRIGDAEVAVRLPSAIIGVISLVVFAAIAWAIGGPWVAIFATILLAIYPEGLRLARFGRFYMLQLLSGLVAMYGGWRLIRDPLWPETLTHRRLLRDWAWALLTAVSFAYATTVQVTTLSVAAGFVLVVAAIGLRDLVRLRSAAWRYSVPWQLTALGIVVAASLLVFQFGLVEETFWRARAIPMWARLSDEGSGPVTAYYRALSGHFPLIISLLPLIFLIAILRQPRTGWFLLAWFGVPLLLHSIVFGWKSERYVLLAVPALLLASGIAATAAAEALMRYFSGIGEKSFGWPPERNALSGLATAGVLTIALVTQPAFNTARRAGYQITSAGYIETERILETDSSIAHLPIGSASPLVALHYWGRLDFTVQQAMLESWTRDTTSHDLNRPFLLKPVGSRDVYAGRPTLTTPRAIQERFSRDGAVVIGIDQKYITFHNIDSALIRTLREQADEMCRGKCGSMLLYRWRFQPPATH
ncbi:MAG: hypothetical protein ABI679_03325 [Gemmatimonadota bacterium]